MKRLNFNTLKNINVPEDWIKNALDVPQKTDSKKHSKIIKISRVASVAACFVIVGVITLFTMPLHKDYGNSIKMPEITPTTTSSNTAENYTDSTNDSNRKTGNSNGSNSVFPLYDGTVGKTEDTRNNPDYSIYNHNITSIPTENNGDRKNPTQGEEGTAWSNVFPFFPTVTTPNYTTPNDSTPYVTTPYTSVNPTSNTVPAATATISSSSMYTQPTSTAIAPTSPICTEPTYVEPTEETKPTNPVYDDPSTNVVCRGVWSPLSDSIESERTIYCRIYKTFGDCGMLGDSNLYSNQHNASTKTDNTGNVVAEYYPLKKGITLNNGVYKFYFYNGYGEILYSSYLYVKK